MASPVVSIVLPVRNGAATLDRAIHSIVAQGFEDWELVVVDDGSTDTTADCLRSWVRRDTRIRIYPTQYQGLVAALNHGVAMSAGSFIARMDADDEMRSDRLSRQLELFESDPRLGLVSCRVEFGGDRNTSAGYALHVDWLNSLVKPVEITRSRFVESPLAHPSVMWRRSVWEQHGGYRTGDFPEDYELWLRWLEVGVRMQKVPAPLMIWHDSPGRLSRTDQRYHPEAFHRVKAPYVARELRRAGHGRKVWVAGAGRPTRKRAAWLEREGVTIAGYLDLDPRKIGQSFGGRPVISPDDLPSSREAMVVSYLGKRGARQAVQNDLLGRGFIEGVDFWLCA
ncbi:MAG: glycosyltransferase family A protein [Synoicihabitans sp.]